MNLKSCRRRKQWQMSLPSRGTANGAYSERCFSPCAVPWQRRVGSGSLGLPGLGDTGATSAGALRELPRAQAAAPQAWGSPLISASLHLPSQPPALSSAGCLCPGCFTPCWELNKREMSLKRVLLRTPRELLCAFPAEQELFWAVFPGLSHPGGSSSPVFVGQTCHPPSGPSVISCKWLTETKILLPVPHYILLNIFLPSKLSLLLFLSLCGPTVCGTNEEVLKCIFTKSPSLVVLVLEDSKWERQRRRSVGEAVPCSWAL